MMSVDFEKRQNELRGARDEHKERYDGGVREHVGEQLKEGEEELRRRVKHADSTSQQVSTDGTEHIPGAL